MSWLGELIVRPSSYSSTKQVHLKCLRNRRTAPLAAHLKTQHVEFMQFAFRWMNCLLMRELSVRNIVRMWDTYLVRLSSLLFLLLKSVRG